MTKPLRIGYAGTLMSYDPNQGGGGGMSALKQWFWTYKPDNLNFSTRSGYFLFKGLEALKKRRELTGDDIQIEFWGDIYPDNAKQAKAMGLDDIVKISGFCSKAETQAKLAACDVLFLPLESEKDGQRPLFIPGKLYDYLKLRKPILALAGPSDCLTIIENSGLGATAPAHDAEKIADVLQKMIEQKDEIAEHFKPNDEYIEGFNMERLTKKLSSIFDELHP